MASSSDEEDPAPKKQRIYYGSLEEQERERLEREGKEKLAAEELLRAQGSESSESEESSEDEEESDKKKKQKKKKKKDDDEAESAVGSAIDKAIKAGNINLNEGETIEINTDLTEERQNELMAEFEKRKVLRSINVSTDDAAVKAKLRELGHPICLFGEGPAQRRERLRDLLSVFEQFLPGYAKELQLDVEEEEVEEEVHKAAEVWYHEGSESLKVSRLHIAEYSLRRADERLETLRKNADNSESDLAVKTQELHRKSRALVNFCSQIGDSRPLSYCEFAPNGKLLATASWSGLCKLWSVPDGNEVRVLKGHSERVGAIVFHPQATVDLEENVLNMVSCDTNGNVEMWNLVDDSPIGNIEGHEHRVSSIAFHPSGRFLGTTCFDKSWRLWDMEQQEEVLHQEGHSKEVYKICFQNDGALAATGGFDARGLIWDLRTGRNIMTLDGHLSKVLALDFSPNCFQISTGSEDQQCKVWDLRKQQCIYTIPAHTNLVSHLKFCSNSLLTASFDGVAKIWAVPTYTPLKTLSGHEQKVTCIDTTSCGNYIATCSFDRTFKLWAPEFLV